MIVQRFTYRIKPGAADQVIEMLRGEEAKSERKGKMRIYECTFGPGDTLVMDLEFEELGEVFPFWEAWFAQPTSPAFMEKWNQLVKHTVSNEIWSLA